MLASKIQQYINMTIHHSQGDFHIWQSTSVIYCINTLKKKDHNINAEKAHDNIQHTFMIKSLRKVKLEGNLLKLIKNTYQNSMIKYQMPSLKDQEQFKDNRYHHSFKIMLSSSHILTYYMIPSIKQLWIDNYENGEHIHVC